MVCSVVGVVAVIGDSNCVCNVLALHSGAHMGDVYRAVDIHSGILHTDVSRVFDSKAGGLQSGLVEVQLCLQKTGVQLIRGIQQVVAGIAVAIIFGQYIQRTDNDDGVGLCAGSQIANIEVGVVGVEIIAFDSVVIYSTVVFRGIKAGVHLIFAAVGVQNYAVTNIQHGVTGVVENNDIAGAHGGFIVLEEGVDLICIIPAAVVANAEFGIISIIEVALAFGVPAHNCHIIGIAGGAPKSHSQTVELVAEKGIVKSFLIYVKAVATADGICGLIGGCRLGGDIQRLTAVAAAVAAQRFVVAQPTSGVQGDVVVLIFRAHKVEGPCHFYQSFFHICAGDCFGVACCRNGECWNVR